MHNSDLNRLVIIELELFEEPNFAVEFPPNLLQFVIYFISLGLTYLHDLKSGFKLYFRYFSCMEHCDNEV